MLLQLAGFIFDCTCIILPKPIVHIDNYCYLYCSTLFIPCTALYFILHFSYTLKRGHFENKPFIHSFLVLYAYGACLTSSNSTFEIIFAMDIRISLICSANALS